MLTRWRVDASRRKKHCKTKKRADNVIQFGMGGNQSLPHHPWTKFWESDMHILYTHDQFVRRCYALRSWRICQTVKLKYYAWQTQKIRQNRKIYQNYDGDAASRDKFAVCIHFKSLVKFVKSLCYMLCCQIFCFVKGFVTRDKTNWLCVYSISWLMQAELLKLD